MNIKSLTATFIKSQLKRLLGDIGAEFGNEIEQFINNRILEYQSEEYNRNLYAKTLLHRIPKKLTDFYQPLFISNHRYKPKYSVEAESSKELISTDSIQTLFSNDQYITLIGTAGSGKSTLVKHLFLNAIDRDFKVPIKIELRYLNNSDDSLISYIKESVFKLNKLASNQNIIERLMESGKFVFFLDGYDEIHSVGKERITKQIDDLVKLYNKNFYLITTRPFTEIEMLPLFHNYEVCELRDNQIEQFIRRQIPESQTELIEKMIEAINKDDIESYRSFLTNPLLLSMFILTFQSDATIPKKRSDFYGKVFDALYSEHDSMSKLAYVREKQSGLSKRQISEVLELFSFISHFTGNYNFNNNYLNDVFDKIKDKKKHLNFDNIKLISDLKIAIGIIHQDGLDYSFPHRSLQEYFAALYMSSLNEVNKQELYSKLTNRFTRGDLTKSNTGFYLYQLISELDTNSVIKFIIIPFLEEFIKKAKTSNMNTIEIFECLMNLESFFVAFQYVLDDDSFVKALNSVVDDYEQYIVDFRKKKRGHGFRNSADYAREKLAKKELKTSFIDFIPIVQDKVNELNAYLDQQSQSDRDILKFTLE